MHICGLQSLWGVIFLKVKDRGCDWFICHFPDRPLSLEAMAQLTGLTDELIGAMEYHCH